MWYIYMMDHFLAIKKTNKIYRKMSGTGKIILSKVTQVQERQMPHVLSHMANPGFKSLALSV